VIKAEPQPPMIKPEPVEGRVVNRKRSGTHSVFQEIVPKKIKADAKSFPMGEVDVKPPPLVNAEAIRGELLELQREINLLQPQVDLSKRKIGKSSTTHLKKELKITAQLIALQQRKKELTGMLPAVPAPTHPTPGPSFRSDAVDGFAQPGQLHAFVQPSVPSTAAASGSDLSLNPLRDDPMDTDSDADDPAPPFTSDMDPPFVDNDSNRMLVDGAGFNVDFRYNAAKADE